MLDAEYTIGVDIGGTKIEVGLVDAGGSVVARGRCGTPVERGASAVIEAVVGLISDVISDSKAHRSETGAPHKKTGAKPNSPPDSPLGKGGLATHIGIGVAGQVDGASGVVRFAPNLQWCEVPLGAEIARRTGLAIAVTNDVRAITWGEWLRGGGRGGDDLICLYVGTGIGGGVVSGGRMLDGAANCAAEVGHMIVAMGGPACTCGGRGCLEALAGGWAIARRAREACAADAGAGRRLMDLAGSAEAISTEMVCQAEREGDRLAVAVLREASRALVAGCVSLVHAFNPSRLILGGGVIDGRPRFVDELREGVMAQAMAPSTAGLEVLPAALGKDAGVIGAALFARRTLEK